MSLRTGTAFAAVRGDYALRVVYAARRFGVAREMYEARERMRPAAADTYAARAPRTYAVPGANRPSDEQVDDQVMTDLSLLMDVFMEATERQVADFMFDEIDVSVADRYTRMLERTQNVSYRRHEVVARNLLTGQNETRVIEIRANADFRLDTVHLGSIAVAGKSDPLVFAADVVANASLAPPHDAAARRAVERWNGHGRLGA